MNRTIDYYNNNAEQYYQTTITADLDSARKKFASYLPAGASVIDIGCGSGRDVLAFNDMGFNAVGLDASDELVELARERLGINVVVASMSSWRSYKSYDGIWCCASLMHLDDAECKQFFANLDCNLKSRGVLYISVKSGISTGIDEVGRYMRNFTEEEIREMVDIVPGLLIKELWYTEDSLQRNDFRWMNVIAERALNNNDISA